MKSIKSKQEKTNPYIRRAYYDQHFEEINLRGRIFCIKNQLRANLIGEPADCLILACKYCILNILADISITSHLRVTRNQSKFEILMNANHLKKSFYNFFHH